MTMKFFFEISGTVEADDEDQAAEKLKAGVGLEDVNIDDLQQEEIPEEDDDDEEITTP